MLQAIQVKGNWFTKLTAHKAGKAHTAQIYFELFWDHL